MHRTRKTAVIGAALATTALTLSSIGVAAQTPGVPEVPTGYTELDQALAGEFAGTTVTMQTQWTAGQGDEFAANIQPFLDATGIKVNHAEVPSGQHETLVNLSLQGGQASDILQLAQPAVINQYGEDGLIVELSTIMDLEKLASEQPALNSFQTENGTWAIPYKFDVKSTVWYPIKAFEAAGYEVPTTWDELIALSDRIVADGSNPWCLAIEDGPGTGWLATDWVEDILLRTAGIDAYKAWYLHELPFDSPEIREALDYVAQIFFTDGYVWGGTGAIVGTNLRQAMDPMWGATLDSLEAPECWMHKQATWYGPSFFPDEKATGEDSEFIIGEDLGLFYFPVIKEELGAPVLSAGDGLMVSADRPEVRAFAQWLASPEGMEVWVRSGKAISPNSGTPAEWVEGNYKGETAATMIGGASALGFDASDLMPGPVGAGSFWTGMVDWIGADGTNTDEVLAAIDASWPAE